MKKNVAITGIGVVTPLGWRMEDVWEKWQRRESAICENGFTGQEAFPHCLSARVGESGWSDRIPNRKLIKLMSRESQMAAAAASLALADARIDGCYAAERIGIYMGTGLTSDEMDELLPVFAHSFDEEGRFSSRLLGSAGLPNCNPLLSFKILTNMAACFISMLHGIHGENLVLNPWPGNTAQAVMAGARAIADGGVDCALVGGCDSKTHFIGFLTFSQLGLLSQSGCCRPFEQESDGLVLGEGAAILVLESLDHAQERHAPVYAEIAGYSEATDALSSGLYPENAGVLKGVLQGALAAAGIDDGEIGAICCSAGSHPVGDRHEAEALAAIFPRLPPLSSLKPYCGDLLAAAPALALSAAAYAIREQVQPPALKLQNPQPQIPCDLDGRRRPMSPQAIMVNVFDLGVTKASLILRRVA